MRGEENRRKVAETFKRPTRWGQYCREVSPTNCTEPDLLAQRAPLNDEEENSFFVEGLFFGHFRHTEKSNCDKFPTNCTGFFGDYPCAWTSFAQPQAYHLDIAFSFEGPESNGGFSYDETVQIWSAANATKSPVAVMWWTPEPILETFIGTDAEYTRVLFPTPTQECQDNRIDFRTMCDPDVTYEEKMGDPAGVCDSYPQAIKTAISEGLLEISENPNVDEEFWSPAYEVVNNFRVDNLQLDRMFQYWAERNTDRWNFDPRAAVCQWASENLDLLQTFVPESHPRVIEQVESSGEPIFQAALAMAGFAALLLLISIAMTYAKRKTKVLYYAQTELLFLIQIGMLLTTGGAITYALKNPSTATCSITSWLTNIGFVLQLIPLWMRIYEINQLAASGKQMQRARLRIWKVYACVATVAVVVATLLLVWTLVDPAREVFGYEMAGYVTPEGETIINAHAYCGSENEFWCYIMIAWRAAVLIPACMIASLALRVKEDLNDTKTLSSVLFIKLLFQILLVVSRVLMEDSDSHLMGFWSILLSADTILSLSIYILPKFWDAGKNLDEEPLPDVFVHTTVAFLDVEGFTAW